MASTVEKLLRDNGYYLSDGHYKLVSGRHSNAYVQARISLMDPKINSEFRTISTELIRDQNVSAVAGFTVGGLLLADEIAKYTKLPLVVGYKPMNDVEWLGAENIRVNSKVLLVDDVLTTASQIRTAIRSLEDISNISELLILVAVDRSNGDLKIKFRDDEVRILDCIKIPLSSFNPSECPSCFAGIPTTDLSNPEKDVVSVVLTQPRDKSDFILKGYEKVYKMQRDQKSLDEMKAWKLWMPVLLAGLPMARAKEDSSLIKFVSYLTTIAGEHNIKPRVLSEIIGQLIRLSSIRVESRAIGCSMIVGNIDEIGNILESRARVRMPININHEKLTELVPHFDALLETNYAIVLSNDGKAIDFRRLNFSRSRRYIEGIELVRFVTANSRSIGFVLRRGRSAIAVYNNGRLEAIGELSERSGLWEFSRPMDRIEEIQSILKRNVQELLLTLVEASRELVARGHGALFVVGNVDSLNHTVPKIEIEPQNIKDMTIEDLVELAKLDGAVLITEDGRLLQATVILKNRDEGTFAGQQAGTTHGGSRKETAIRTSIECPNCAVINISQNGAIEIYVHGESWPISESFSGLSR
ncbi:MAG: DNA integrity scanning protein DisA nucleotide-binding domain protein [Desulfobacterales bacterium]|nr:DNA integrity scanning protein DisA nucleotide-binding domain protein [Desulfobacterales bacterium]